MLNENPKITLYKFSCEKCGFNSNNKKDYHRHLQTKKHNANNANQDANQKTHVCICGKSYKHLSSFSRHKLTCE